MKKEKKDHSSSAQMMHPASSGPVLVIATLHHSPVAYFVNINHKTLVSMLKKYEKMEKKLTQGPNDARSVIWAHFHCSALSCLFIH